MHGHINKSILTTITVSYIWDLRKVVAHKKNFNICHLRRRFMLLAYLNPIYYIYVELV